VALIDLAGAGECGATWADVNIARVIEDKVSSTEGATVAR